MHCRASYYQQFDADYSLAVPAEGYGGWQSEVVELNRASTAVISMHAWDCGTLEESRGMWRSVEYLPRSYEIAEQVLRPLYAAVRRTSIPLLHVVGGEHDYYRHLPGYARTVEVSGPRPAQHAELKPDPATSQLWQLKSEKAWRGAHNWEDAKRQSAQLDFLDAARPVEDEWIVEDSWQLAAICRQLGIDHLIYSGFAIDACLLCSPGGMLDMSRQGALCSVVRDAVTAVENKESAAVELHKQTGLWRVGTMFGLVFDSADLIAAMAIG